MAEQKTFMLTLEDIRGIQKRAWDACVKSIVNEDGTPAEIVEVVNPYES